MSQPNILFLFPDQWRTEWFGALGLPVRTPNLDRLAARGLRFDQCRTNSPLCAPSRSCLSSGLRFRACGVRDNTVNLDPRLPNCWQALRTAGYRVATCGKNDIHKGDKAWSDTGWVQQLGRLGFTEAREHAGKHDAGSKLQRGTPCLYGSLLRQAGRDVEYGTLLKQQVSEHTLPRRLYTDDVCGEQALTLLTDLPTGAPWCLWVNFPGPHEPFDPPAELARRYDGVAFPPPVDPAADDRDHQRIRRNYAAMMEGIDEWCGRILDAIERRGELDDTIVIFSSDHGEMLGDHGRFGKSVAYDAAVRVPLIVAGPQVRTGRSDALVELCDLAPTLTALGGVDPPASWHGRSLLPILHDAGAGAAADAAHRPHQIMELGAWEAITDGRLKLVRHADGRRQVFDLATDPSECRDLSAAAPAALAALEGALDADPCR